MRKLTLAALAIATAAAPRAHAFCGFYVSGSGGKMFNDATEVVLMRAGTRTVLSMQNDYKGPLEDFALVIPVPVVLKEKDVKTLPADVFAHVDSLGSPRLVEYWEQDPCPLPDRRKYEATRGAMPGAVAYDKDDEKPAKKSSVKIEAQFDVAEYQIVILSATDSAGLEEWLKQSHYKIPDGAEPLLRPYVEGGSKFFVAKVDPKKVQMVDGHAALSPIRFNYDSDDFSLPIRLGMANSSGKQDLIVNILSEDKRYEVANYKNVFIPTNFDVKNNVKQRFGEFYAALFDATVAANPHAVVTEYAWTAQQGYHCDPCPDLDVNAQDMMTLGGDVVGGNIANHFVMTRLHARYGKSDMKDDLRFREAKAVTGGREMFSKKGIEYGAQPSEENYFQGRYVIRHQWTGPIKCKNPQRGVWGGPPDGSGNQVIAASKVAFAPRGKFQLASSLTRDLWEIGFKKAAPAPQPGFAQPPKSGGGGGVGQPVKFMGFGAGGALLLLGLGTLIARKKK
jgi:hypothetical protein